MRLEKEIKSALKQIKQWAIECKRKQPGFSGKYKSEDDRINSLKLITHIYQKAEDMANRIDYRRCVYDKLADSDWTCGACGEEMPDGIEVWYDKEANRHVCEECAEDLNREQRERDG